VLCCPREGKSNFSSKAYPVPAGVKLIANEPVFLAATCPFGNPVPLYEKMYRPFPRMLTDDEKDKGEKFRYLQKRIPQMHVLVLITCTDCTCYSLFRVLCRVRVQGRGHVDHVAGAPPRHPG